MGASDEEPGATVISSEGNEAKLRVETALTCGDLLLSSRLCRSLRLISRREVVASSGWRDLQVWVPGFIDKEVLSLLFLL